MDTLTEKWARQATSKERSTSNKHFTQSTTELLHNTLISSSIMADSSLSQTRVLSESDSEVDEPVHKKLRLDDHGKES